MTVEKVREIRDRVRWKQYEAIIEDDNLTLATIGDTGQPDLAKNIMDDPQGFVDYATAIRDTLNANKPPEPKKPRRDKGIPRGKKSILTGEPVSTVPYLHEPPLFDIHTGINGELHTITYGPVKAQGKTLKETLELLEKTIRAYGFGYDWRETLTPKELTSVLNIENYK